MSGYDRLWESGRLHLSRMLLPRKGMWAVAWLLGMVTLGATVGLLALSGWFITAAGLAGLVSLATAYTFNYMGPAAIIRLFAIVRTAGRYGERWTSHDAVLALLADLRSGIFAKLAAGSGRQQSASARQMHRLTGDIDLLNAWPLSVVLPWLWAMVMLALILLVAGLAGGSTLLWTALPLVMAAVAVPAWAARGGVAWADRQADEAETRRLTLLNPLSAITALLQWQQWPRFAARFRQADERYMAGQLQQQQMTGLVVLLQQVFLAAAFAVLLWQGSALTVTGVLSVPLLLALLLALFGFSEQVLQLGMQMTAYGLSRAACRRLNDMLPEKIEESEKVPLPEAVVIRADRLSARIPGALNGAEDVSFSLAEGGILVLEGPSGAGKSTLLQVLADELAPQSGTLTANGIPYDSCLWRGEIGYLAQQPDIFNLTLAQNLRFGKKAATDAELWEVLEKTALADWAKAQPEGLDTPLGEYGSAVSGGQARRIALARLLLKPYRLLLLDEPFAGLDEETRLQVASMLEAHQKHGMLVVVSHHHSPWPQAEVLKIA